MWSSQNYGPLLRKGKKALMFHDKDFHNVTSIQDFFQILSDGC